MGAPQQLLPEKDNSDNKSQISGGTPLRRSAQVFSKPASYPGEISYRPGRGNTFTTPNAHFHSSNTPKSYLHMMKALAMLASNQDSEGSDELLTLKKTMSRPDWPK